MHFSAVVLAGLFAVASAHSSSAQSSSTVAPVSSTTTYTLTPAQSSQATCLEDCKAGDVTCRAACISASTPDATAANNTNNCVAACPKGNGTAADNAAYATCLEDCIKEYSTATGAAASGTGDSGNNNAASTGTGTATGSAASGSGASSGSSHGSSSPSASSTSSSSAADMVRVGGSAVGLLAFLAFFMAL